MRFRNQALARLVPPGRYGTEDLQRVESHLRQHGTLDFSRLPSGLFSASSAGASIASSGYDKVWVRDNVYVAYAHYESRQESVAVDVAHALLGFFDRHRHRFEDIISGAVDPDDAARRPHVRFDGVNLEEIRTERWPHAQNDALGYFLWLYARLARSHHIAPDARAAATLALFPRYFNAIRYWEDEDSGHWEEQRKISASSIGTVVAGLVELQTLCREQPDALPELTLASNLSSLVDDLVHRGRTALRDILPHECAQISPRQNRRYDGALLFLLYPLDVVPQALVELLLHDAHRFLEGEHGIRRYLGDSYWAPQYDERLPEGQRTRDFSEDMEARDVLLEKIGDEAQWCLFDPILSAYYGRRFRHDRSAVSLDRQRLHFNRTLAQITESWRCPELYYLRHGEYVANPHVPLQWTQANLLLALEGMRTTIAASA